MKKLLLAGLLVAATVFLGVENDWLPTPDASGDNAGHSDQQLAQAFEDRRNSYQVQGAGEVIQLLSDDNEGSRHQRFLLRLASGQTLLVAHNIDLAPRVDALRVGDQVSFNGEYEWNARGGVIHWTHHDPRGRHEGGWLKHKGKTYQ